MSTLLHPSLDFEAFPVGRSLVPVVHRLVEREYDPHAIRGAVAHLALHGTAECCPWIDPEDRGAIEAMLPTSADWQSGEWDAHTWATND